jgi:hypothetical protein
MRSSRAEVDLSWRSAEPAWLAAAYDCNWRGRSEAGQSRSRAPTTAMCNAKRWAGSAGLVPVKVLTLASR